MKPLEPVFASLMGAALFREIPGGRTILGGLLVIAGVVLCSVSMGAAPAKEGAAKS